MAKPHRRRGFTLLEILIVISLSGILFGVLFSKIREQVYLRRDLKKAERECLERQMLHIRLVELFSKLSTGSEKEEFKQPLTYKGGQIHCLVDLPLDINPSHLGKNSCTISLAQETGNVTLKIKTSSGEESTEILATGVKKWHLQFFSSEQGKWLKEWPEELEEIPSFLWIQCKKEFGDIEFVLPVNVPTVTYSL